MARKQKSLPPDLVALLEVAPSVILRPERERRLRPSVVVVLDVPLAEPVFVVEVMKQKKKKKKGENCEYHWTYESLSAVED
jgi:hypothetical protein